MNELATAGIYLPVAFTGHVFSILTFCLGLLRLTLLLLIYKWTDLLLWKCRGTRQSSHERRKLVLPAATFALFGLDGKRVKLTSVFEMGNTVSCCVSPESSPKVPSRLTTERLVELQASTEVDTTVPYLQHISDREVPDGRWFCTEFAL